jgi:beta-mannosidase
MSLFNSEYGYGGPCCLESTKEYLGTDSPNLLDEVGRQHTNTFYDLQRVKFSIREHYREPDDLSLEDYILFGGLCQGLNLGYSLESLRANQKSMGGIFWMYNDAWGENGWSIIDYYLRRKISFYNVKRCLAPQRLVLRRGGQAFGGRENEVVLIALNEGAEPLTGALQLGYLSYDGKRKALRTIDFSIEGRSRQLLAAYPLPSEEQLKIGTVVAIPMAGTRFEPVSFRHARFRETGINAAQLTFEEIRALGKDLEVTVGSQTFAHAVHFVLQGDFVLSDHYFDLLPGEKRTVTIYGGAELASKLRVYSVASSSAK